MKRACIFFREPVADRWFKGDHRWRAPVRDMLRGPSPVGGLKRVYLNLLKGLDLIGAEYTANGSYGGIGPSDMVGVIGVGRYSLAGYNKPNPILAGVAVTQHPAEWPTLFEDYPIARYVVHCEWVRLMYGRYYGDRIDNWAVGIDTSKWCPGRGDCSRDILVYDKIRWDRDRVNEAMVRPILAELRRAGLTYELIRYGDYNPNELLSAAHRAKAMLFLCEHETQGMAYQQAMACGLPVLAWDPGQWLDPWRYRYGETYVPATSVPFFDERCGLTFRGVLDFYEVLGRFWQAVESGQFRPREYVLENLTLERAAVNYLNLLDAVNT